MTHWGITYKGTGQTGGLIASNPSPATNPYFYHSDHLGSSSPRSRVIFHRVGSRKRKKLAAVKLTGYLQMNIDEKGTPPSPRSMYPLTDRKIKTCLEIYFISVSVFRFSIGF